MEIKLDREKAIQVLENYVKRQLKNAKEVKIKSESIIYQDLLFNIKE